MATKKKPVPKGEGKNNVQPAPTPESRSAQVLAELAMDPSFNAAAVMASYGKPLGVADDNLEVLFDALAEGVQDVWAGDMKRAEAMLFGQAHALQAIFMTLARRANRQDYLAHLEAYMRMALKAQNQCRLTLETLATIKNPPVVYARQANINNGGQQQVNNGAMPAIYDAVRQAGTAAGSTTPQDFPASHMPAAFSSTEPSGLLASAEAVVMHDQIRQRERCSSTCQPGSPAGKRARS